MHNNNSTPELPFQFFEYLLFERGISDEFNHFREPYLFEEKEHQYETYFNEETLTYHHEVEHDEEGNSEEIKKSFNNYLAVKLENEIKLIKKNVRTYLVNNLTETHINYYKLLVEDQSRYLSKLQELDLQSNFYGKIPIIAQNLSLLSKFLDVYVKPKVKMTTGTTSEILDENSFKFNNVKNVEEEKDKQPIKIVDKKKLKVVLSNMMKKNYIQSDVFFYNKMSNNKPAQTAKIKWKLSKGKSGNGSTSILFFFNCLIQNKIIEISNGDLYQFIENCFINSLNKEFAKNNLKGTFSEIKKYFDKTNNHVPKYLKEIESCF